MKKAWWKSKTMWFNVLTLGLMAAQGQLGIEVPPNVALPVVAIGNALLRIMTSTPIGATDQP